MKGYGYDLIVMGVGSPGEHFAGELADGGLKVAVAEHELAGGECSHRACMPPETLLRPGEAAYQVRHAAATAQVDVAAALAYRDFLVSGYSGAGKQAWPADGRIVLRAPLSGYAIPYPEPAAMAAPPVPVTGGLS